MNNYTYFKIHHCPDRDEGKGLLQIEVISVPTDTCNDYSVLNALVNDYCYKKFGRQTTTAWGQPILNWQFDLITEEYFLEAQTAGFVFRQWNGDIAASYKQLQIKTLPDADRMELDDI